MTVLNRSRLARTTALAVGLAAASSLGLGVTAATASDTTTTSTGSSMPQVVVKVRSADGCSLNKWDPRYAVVVDSPVLASRGIYLVHGTNPEYQTGKDAAKKLADKLEDQDCVAYAEPDALLHLADTQFHSWRQFHSWNGDNAKNSETQDWKAQRATKNLAVTDAQRTSTGAGVTVAVLDTGIDAAHPAFTGRLRAGYDYVGDDSDPDDVATGIDSDRDGVTDSAVGHGTFTSGMVSLIAPQARVMPMRVLDSDGNGNAFVIAQAIVEATDAGVNVINLSFGTDEDSESDLLTDAIKYAYKRGALVVAAAGNGGTDEKSYPAALDTVLSVGALAADDAGLASFSARGGWVGVAAPGTSVIGPLPGNRYGEWSGTSMAAPLVSGQVALLAAVDRLASRTKLDDIAKKRKEFVMKSAREISGVKAGRIDLAAGLKLALED